MAIISDCEFCNWVSNMPNATYTKQTEFYDGIDGLEDIQMCWRCGEVAKFEQERIIKLLESDLLRFMYWEDDSSYARGINLTGFIDFIRGEK